MVASSPSIVIDPLPPTSGPDRSRGPSEQRNPEVFVHASMLLRVAPGHGAAEPALVWPARESNPSVTAAIAVCCTRRHEKEGGP